MDRRAAKDPGSIGERQLALFDEPPPADAGALRSVLLGGRAIEFRFERRRRRTIGIRVGDGGLRVAAPLRAPWRAIEDFLREKQRWILEKLDARAAAGPAPTLFGMSGETLPFFGREIVLVVAQGRRGAALEGSELRLNLPQPQRRGAVRKLLIEWLKSRAGEHFGERAAHFAGKLGLAAPPFAISSARTRWGVCMSNGRIRFSWRLAQLAPDLGDYVVAHEVAHLIELNHSERFWALLEWLYPHWREARSRIERDALALPGL